MSKNQTILKNSLMLYGRTFVSMLIALYTSRVLLEALGVVDFGIYNLVGSSIALFTFFKGAVHPAMIRFFSGSIAKKDNLALSKYFSIAINIQFISAILFFFLAETLGYFLFKGYLNIPPDRIEIAKCVFHISIITTSFSFFSLPLSSLIVSHERMSFYAIMGILESVMRLIIVYFLSISSGDRLIFYAILLFITATISQVLFYLYCKINFKGVSYSPKCNKKDFKEFFSFSFWSLFGGFASMGQTQGLNVVMNSFLGVIVNASMGVAMQVLRAVNTLVNNFTMAFKPQLFKAYAAGDKKYFKFLIYFASKVCFSLMLLLSIPILANTDFILGIWLKEVPEYASGFIQLLLLYYLINTICIPLFLSVQAIGNIRNYQLIVSFLLLLNIPVAIIILYLDYSVYYVIASKGLIMAIIWIWRVLYLSNLKELSFIEYFKEIMTKTIIISSLLYILAYYIKFEALHYQIAFTACIEFLALILIYIILLNKKERASMKSLFAEKLAKFSK